MKLVSHLVQGVILAAACAVVSPAIAAADSAEAVSYLTSHGGLGKRDAQKVVEKVAARMAESADNFAPANDSLRVALSRSLFGTDVPKDNMKAAKVRLRLFAGPSAWSLKALFEPGAGQIASCQREFKLPQKYCEALVAAGGQVSVAEARAAEKGPRTAAAAPATPAAAPSGSRFARYDSGFRGAAKKAPAAAPRPTAHAQPKTPAQPTVAARPAATKATQQSTREAYLARREAYMERQKARMEAAKARKSSAFAAKAAADEPAPAAAAAGVASDVETDSADDAAPAQAAANPAPKAEQQQLSGDFLNDLLADPLGGK